MTSPAKSPMMRQYDEAKALCGDALLLFRMGDFYELFYDDAKVAARALSLTLTSRDKGTNPIPMAGFPHHQLDGYLAKLIQQGFRVAVCDQVEDAKLAKGLVRREVTRVVTPGTLTDDTLLDPKSSNYLAGIVFHSGKRKGCASIGLAWVELSTGEFRIATIAPESLLDHLERIGPAECVISEDDNELAEELTEFFVTKRPAWAFGRDSAQQAVREHFQVATLEGFGIDENDAAGIRAAGATIEYLQETQKTSLAHLDRPIPFRHESALEIDQATRRSLELVCTMRDQSRFGSLLGVLDEAVTPMGSRTTARWLSSPLAYRPAIEARLDAVEELTNHDSLRDDIRQELREVYDLQRLLARVATGRASPRDLKFIGRTLKRLPKIKAALVARKSGLLKELELKIELCPALCEELDRALVDDCPLSARDGGVIRQGYNTTLDELRGLASGGKEWLSQYQEQQQQRTGIPNLKLGFNKVFGFYLEVTNSHRDKVPSDFIRKQTLKNAERFITPELKEYEDRVLSAEEKAHDLEYELFVKLREMVEKASSALRTTAEALAELDAITGLASVAVRRGYCRPQLVEQPTLEIHEGRHPVLDAIMPHGTFIPNDTKSQLERNRLLLITGPNMAGKSTYIRQVALITIMAHMGSFVPAKKALIGMTDRVFARVGASDELAKGQSTFMVEMTETARILNTASERSLVILDEVGRGTSTYDGVSLAWAIVEHLHDSIGCRTLFATHYHELTDLASSNARIANLNVAVRERKDDVVFLHRIVEGPADKSYGIHVAQLAGVPTSVNQRAEEILHWLESTHTQPDTDAAPKSNSATSGNNQYQLTLFETAEHPLIELIREFPMEECSPLDALMQIKAWQQQLSSEAKPVHPK